MSGMEMMLKSMGLGPALDTVKEMVENGTIDKLTKFADGMDELTARQARMEKNVERICEKLGIEYTAVSGSDAGTVSGPLSIPGPSVDVSDANGADR